MTSKKGFVHMKLEEIKRKNLYRTLKKISLVKGMVIEVDGRRAINFSSNDYLGLSQHPAVLKAAKGKMSQVSQCSSRLLSGSSSDIHALEDKLAEHRNVSSALVYPTGYMANIGLLTTLADKDSIIYSDELNHSSIIDGCRLSGASIKVFRHNDISSLRGTIFADRHLMSKRKIIVTEGVFSMNGNIARLYEICKIAKDSNAVTVLDDAHGDFILGHTKEHSGTADLLGVSHLIDVHVSSLSKALGSFGGYVATSHYVRELLINSSKQFIYTSAIPSHLCRAAMAAISVTTQGLRQKRLSKNINYFMEGLKKLGVATGQFASPIIPIMIGNEVVSTLIARRLLKMGIFVQAIRYPTVRRGRAQLRVSITSEHTIEDLEFAISCLEKVRSKSKFM
ncbi:MAG TPA: aminotransferase class I/II-fold pyridoxal phosphate-dependent enzyme [Nitrososphaeraceae archaeon]|nr:aminotransferase class I/II-fold pyridoxal phosphate-dependent enzyme [Nitrososphaeraceae archaeon]